MFPAERAEAYLTLPADLDANPAALRWSDDGEAVVDAYGTLAVRAEVAALLGALFARDAVPPFALVMALYYAAKEANHPGPLNVLTRAYAEAAREKPPGLTRNVGLLLAEGCEGLPCAVRAPDFRHVVAALRRARPRPEPKLPPLDWVACERHVAARLGKYRHEELVHRLVFGGGRPTVPEAEVQPPPGRVLGLIDLARRNPRLAGAALLAPAVDAAFTLPPRRRRADALPQGGYADVATRGDPGRLLPSQLALDADDFVRRFAAGELLYFQREEPHSPPPPRRVVLLDQGVRTWGSVRLALAGAALALLTPRGRHPAAATLWTTGGAPPLDADSDPAALAERLQASDLSKSPSGVLSRAVCREDDSPRDLIALTHPRTATESWFGDLARLRSESDRFFALTVDEHGSTELLEWAADGPRLVRAFRLDLAAAEAARPVGDAPKPARPADPRGWSGDAEPVPFPFRAGLTGEPDVIGFDAHGEWLVCVGRDGVPHAVPPGGGPVEVLPRGVAAGRALREVEAVLGVSGGVVVCGRVGGLIHTRDDLTDPVARFVAAHYDFAARAVRVHVLGRAEGPAAWSAHPTLSCVSVRPTALLPAFDGWAVDLTTGGRWPSDGAGLVARARAAWAEGPTAPRRLLVVPEDGAGVMPPVLATFPNGFAVVPAKGEPRWEGVAPKCDGKWMLEGAAIESATLAGATVALTLLKPGGKRTLAVFRGPSGALAGEFDAGGRPAPFALSADGRRLARWRGRRELVAGDVAATGPPEVAASPAHLHTALELALESEPLRVSLRVGAFEHHFAWRGGAFAYSTRWDGPTHWGRSVRDVPALRYDAARFPPRESVGAGPWTLAFDRLGQALLYRGDELAAAFLVRRDRAAAWLPGGVLWGDAALLGGPPTPGAERALGGLEDEETGGVLGERPA